MHKLLFVCIWNSKFRNIGAVRWSGKTSHPAAPLLIYCSPNQPNNVFLSQQTSQNSIFQPSFRPTNGAYVGLQHCNEKSHVTFHFHIFLFNVPNRPTFRRNAMRKYIRHMSHISQDFSYTKHITCSEARGAVTSSVSLADHVLCNSHIPAYLFCSREIFLHIVFMTNFWI